MGKVYRAKLGIEALKNDGYTIVAICPDIDELGLKPKEYAERCNRDGYDVCYISYVTSNSFKRCIVFNKLL